MSRPNRFIALVELGAKTETVHVKNTGRCRELLLPGVTVYLQEFLDSPTRKTKFDLIAVQRGDRLINMDSMAPNKVFGEWAAAGHFCGTPTLIKPETTYKNSRFDFYLEADARRIFVEVKGVTLEQNGVALFPDAPTQRGVKHLHELGDCHAEGYEAFLVLIIQMRGVAYFTPNRATHPAFGDALETAARQGVTILALDCNVTPDSLTIRQPVEVILR